ncbi:MAG: TonB-dependent receptor [Bacteroidota bacterium]
MKRVKVLNGILLLGIWLCLPQITYAQKSLLNQQVSIHYAGVPTHVGYDVVGNQSVIKQEQGQHPQEIKPSNSKFTLSGYIRDAANGEALIGASVSAKGLPIGASTNEYGFYSLTLPQGNYSLTYGYVGYESKSDSLLLSTNLTRNVNLTEQVVQIKEVVISAKKLDENVKSLEMSVNKLDIKTVKLIPAFMGEVDVTRTIQLLPGVSTVGEGAAGFNVRGGGIDQNLILLDEAPVYNSSHMFGLFSLFNSDAVKDMKLLKGGIPAQYGGRLSSLLDVRMKEGNSKQLSASGGSSYLFSRLTVEAPIIKDKSSFIISGRRSYMDLLAKLLDPKKMRNNQQYYYDLNAKFNYTINENNKIYVSGYFGKDVFKTDTLFHLNWGNATSTIRWNHLFNSRLFANFTGIYSDYDYGLGVPKGPGGFELTSKIINYSAKADFTYYLNTNNTLNFGASAILYNIRPGTWKPAGDKSIYMPIELAHQKGVEYAVYLDNEQHLSPRLAMQYGLRFSMFDYIGSGTAYDYEGSLGEKKMPVNSRTYGNGESIQRYGNLEPRLSARYSLTETSSLKASYNRMAQYVHLISNTTAASPLDVWSTSTNNIKPEIADQGAVGYFRNFHNNAYEYSVEGFYKNMSNQIDYINGADLLLNSRLEGELTYGKGRAYGVELYLKKNEGRLTGWVSYTLSRSERLIEGINNNQWYKAKYDKTHNLSVVGIYALKPRLTVSAVFAYGTGVSFTTPDSKYIIGDIAVPNNSTNDRNNVRVPAYHRLDISATLKNKKTPKKRWESEWVFSIYNLYSRRNAYSIYFRPNEKEPTKTEAVRLSIFGIPIPSVTYNFKF